MSSGVGLGVEIAIAILAAAETMLLFVYSRTVKRFSAVERSQRATENALPSLRAELHADVRQGVADMTTALVRQDEEFTKSIDRVSEDMARQFQRQEDALVEAVRTLAVITTRFDRTSQDVDNLLGETHDLTVLTAILKERLDRFEQDRRAPPRM